MKISYLRILLFFGYLLIAIPIFPASLELVRTIVPQHPFTATKIIVYKDNIYLMSSSDEAINVIDGKGQTIRQLGSKGEGPGEFKYIADFTIFQDQFILGGGKRVQIFSPEGKLIQFIKTKKIAEKLITAGKHWYYSMGWHKINRETRKIIPLIALCSPDGKILHSFHDESLQNAYNPSSGGKFVSPWFPSPFHNRLIFVSGNGTKPAIFMSRRKEFYLIDENRLPKQPIKAKLVASEVTEQDKEVFFGRVDPKPHKKTRQSVVFPETNEYFLGVIPWDRGWALITPDSIVVLNEKGSHMETIALPETLREVVSEIGWPEDIFYKGKDLYVIREYEEVMVFALQ